MDKELSTPPVEQNKPAVTPEITADTFEESIQKNPQLQACFDRVKKETDPIRISIFLQPLVYHKMGLDLMDDTTSKAFRTMYDSLSDDGVLVKDHIVKYLNCQDVVGAVSYTVGVFEAWLAAHPSIQSTVH
ncbi:MAG: hypothetical protein KBD15_03325 [Candidatus Magasanikbacteria bacterium]|nr:hypothetical protein [Candidatus Magasanikbacteria bacterium]